MLSDITLIAFLIGCAGTVGSFFFFIGSLLFRSPKKKLAAKLLGGFIGLAILAIVVKPVNEEQDDSSQYVTADPTYEAQADSSEEEEEAEEPVEEAVEEELEEEPTESPVTIERENIVGSSDKDINDIFIKNPSSVRNDVTGNWRVATTTTSEDITEYAKSYYEEYFSDQDEIHGIVNFGSGTTTKISVLFSGVLSVTVHEYVEGEENDAKALFGGNVLKDYWIYLDNGDIEDIQE